ncbi:MAG: glucose-6-phosphate dehydrogenase [bacterium]
MDSFTLVIIGITSNLAQIKLIPTLYDLIAGHNLPPKTTILGIGRTPLDQTAFATYIDQVLHAPNRHHTHPIDPQIQAQLISHFRYLPLDLTNSRSYQTLKQEITDKPGNLLYYLATFPSLYASIFASLKNHALLTESPNHWVRLLIEKPIGTDQSSARELNNLLTSHFREDQIFRLDHYLGKETLQNILTFRFGNCLLEPLMNSQYVDHIQVTASEDFGIGGRGNYYDQNGALRDVGQNHLLQMIALATMDAPDSYSTKDIMDKRIEAISALTPLPRSLVVGQYESYLKEKDISSLSLRETFFAYKTELTQTNFAHVPIYVRGGKKLKKTATEISLVFKKSQNRKLSHLEGGDLPNILTYRIQPNEGIVLKIMTKALGHTFKLQESYLQYCYPHNQDLPDAYERLIVDAIKGDQTFFNDAAEVDAQWAFTDQLLLDLNTPPLIYPDGSWGPIEADAMIAQDGRSWLIPSDTFCQI